MNAIAGFDPRDDTSQNTHWTIIARAASEPAEKDRNAGKFFQRTDRPEVAQAFDAAVKHAEAAGLDLVPIRVPDPAAINTISRVILLAEASALMEPYLHRRADFGADVLALFDQGRLLAATDYINAPAPAALVSARLVALWNKVDCIFTPTAPIVAPQIGDTTVDLGGDG